MSLINPSGWRLHLHNLAFLQSKFFTGWLVEYQSTNFQSAGAHGFLAWLVLLVLVLALARPRLKTTAILLLLVWVYFALYAGRNIPLLALITAPVLAPGLADGLRRVPWLARARWGELADRMTMFNGGLRGELVTAGLAILLVVAVPRPTSMPPDRWPVAAVEYVQAHPTWFRGPVFNQYAWGGYLIRYLPEHRVFVDGRADFYGEDLVREFDDTTALRPNWRDPLVKYGVTWTLMPKDHRLNRAVAELGWKQVYEDDVAVIFRHQP
ncbi:hypothetical protein HQ590_07845 [bacterium]|nr:hypothetical protein [bacterium]